MRISIYLPFCRVPFRHKLLYASCLFLYGGDVQTVLCTQLTQNFCSLLYGIVHVNFDVFPLILCYDRKGGSNGPGSVRDKLKKANMDIFLKNNQFMTTNLFEVKGLFIYSV